MIQIKSLKLFLFRNFLFILVFCLININSIYSQNFVSKKGGICFRTDDDQEISKYLEYAALFNKYNQKFCLAINLGRPEITPVYIDGLKQIQASGHEIMDHTPIHETNFFTTILPTDYYVNNPGVQRILGNKIELKYVPVNIGDAERSGYVNVNGNIITSTSGIFSSFSKSNCYIYFPALNKLLYIYSWIDQNTIQVTDFWRNDIDLGTHNNIQFYNFDQLKVHLTIDAWKALAEETLRLAEYYNLQRPYTWIQPGSYFPRVYRNEAKQAWGDALGYKSAGLYPEPSLKVFNEYNPNNDKQFGMDWGDFRDDIWTLKQSERYIADGIAKHHVLIGHTHLLYNTDDGSKIDWQDFLNRTEGLLQWCVANNIPIRTYSEWADILYNKVPDPNENIFPPLNVDLDGNNYPDGYNWEAGVLIKNDGVPTVNDYAYTISSKGNLCSINDLGGLEKGTNDFEIWTKGAPGDFIEVVFKVGSQNFIYKFPAESSEWTKYNLAQSVNGNTSLNIPIDVSLINVTIRCSNYSSGEVRISGMKLAKSLNTSNYLTVTPANQNVEYTAGSSTFTVTSNINWTVSKDAGWLTVSPLNGTNSKTITVTYQDNPGTGQRVGTITINGNGIDRIVTITQVGIPLFLTVTPEERNIEYSAGSTTFSVETNTIWTVSNDTEWLTVLPSYGSNNGTLTVTYKDNMITSQRIGTITINGEGITRTVTITQKAAPFLLTVMPDERTVGYTSGNTLFVIESNTNWKLSYDPDWLTVYPESGSNKDTITAAYTDNIITSPRVANITIKSGEINKTITITQEAAPFALAVTPEECTVGYLADSAAFNVESNTNWTITSSCEWITEFPEKGSESEKLIVKYSENLSSDKRVGTITVNGGGITKIVTVEQDSRKFLTDAPNDTTLPPDSGMFNLIIESNTDWEIKR